MDVKKDLANANNLWEPITEAFFQWLGNRTDILRPALAAEPTIKVMIFLALLDTGHLCSYADIRRLFKEKKVINGSVPDNTLRTSVLNLGKTLDKFKHSLELKALRGRFQLIPRVIKSPISIKRDALLILDPPAFAAEEIACDLVEKGMLPIQALYFLEWSARWWQAFSSNEVEIRLDYEVNAWEKLGIKNRLYKNNSQLIGMVGLAPGEGLAEIALLKKILYDDPNKKIHYLAIDSSQRLLRDHINLLKETLSAEIESGRLICVGIIADIYNGLRDAIAKSRNELVRHEMIQAEQAFLPSTCSILVTYLGNCLGNNYQDQETEFFSIVHSIFQNRPLEFLVGVSVMRSTADIYKRNWDDFLLQTPKHLLETKKLLKSGKPLSSNELNEFNLQKNNNNNRCPPVIPETYTARHQITGQIYRFYYQLAFDLKIATEFSPEIRALPKDSLILLYNIIKYNMASLVKGIEKCGLFKVRYDKNYHQLVDTFNGTREYAVFSAFLEK